MSRKSAIWMVPFLCFLLLAIPVGANTQVGDAGHYLTRARDVFVHNPDGRAFELELRRFPWWIGHGWNRPDLAVQVFDGAGKGVFDQTVQVEDHAKVAVPAGAPGAWRVHVDAGNGLNYWYLSCTLDRSVVRVAQDADGSSASVSVFNPFVPRTWHFWVPPGTERFRIRALNTAGRSQREDHGITVFSPRGQRMAVLWGQANPDASKQPVGTRAFALQEAEVLVEPGSAGRFWSVELRMGDSHTYSDVNLVLEGVPPFLARSPEEWFDPDTGTLPAIPCYDETEFVQSDRTPGTGGLHQHWTPCPALGDPDACELLCPARIALWNPEDRPLKLVVGTYLPRNMFPEQERDEKGKWKGLPEAQHNHARVKAVGADGSVLLEESVPLLHLHGGERWQQTLRTGAGMTTLDITGAEHFWAYTYPATPAVLVGQLEAEVWHRFLLEAGTARNWYFHVPRGTKSFAVRFAAADETDVLELRVRAPDRTVAAHYGRSGECDVAVPEGLDGKIWHVRLDVGEATRFLGTAANPRFPSLRVTLDLKGVPGFLAPTREQWFDPSVASVPNGQGTRP